jgi:protein-disulfide isomerase
MAPPRRLSLACLALSALLSAGAAPAVGQPAAKPSLAPEESLGNPRAKVTVIEYASASCPHCARFNNEVFPAFKKKYIDTGKVHYVFREFLTEPVQFAGTAFMIARCAGDKKYFAVLDDVFRQQEAIYQSGDLGGGLLKVASQFGMNKEQINACLDKKEVDALNERLTAADKAGIEATPTFLIGDKKLEGEQTLDELSAAIDPLLAR